MSKKYLVFLMMAVMGLGTMTGVASAQLFQFGKKKTEEAASSETLSDKDTADVKPMRDAPESFADLAESLLPAVVNISSTQKIEETPRTMPQIPGMPEGIPMPQFPPGSPFEDLFNEFFNQHGGIQEMPALPPASLGSGFIVDAEKGLVITNNHVIKDAAEIRVTLHDDTTLDAELIGSDDKTDIAVLKVKTDAKLTAVKLGNSDKMRVGDWIVAIGNPFGLGGTVTAGIVSARQRDINAGPYDDFIQTDASINRGNSGGPMFNLQGEVIGINTAIFSPSGGSVGIGFAIPSNLAKPIIDQLVKYGKTRRGWLGVRIQTVTEDIAESLDLNEAHGALVASVTPGGPAEKSDLKPGDIITEFNGRKIHEMRELPRIVAETPIDETVTLKYWRAGKERTTSVSIGELEKAEEEGLLVANDNEPPAPGERKSTAIDLAGMNITELTNADRETYGVPDDVKGVLVVDTTHGGVASEKGLGEGDVIVEINQVPVTNPAEAKAVFDEAAKQGREKILLMINREGDVRFVALKLDAKKKQE